MASSSQQTSGNTLFTAGDSPQACRINGKLNTVFNNIDSCRDPIEEQRIQTVVKNITNIKEDFQEQVARYNDLILQGNTLFGTTPSNQQIEDIKKRNQELKEIKDKLQNEITSANSAAERAERDFLDAKASLPDPLPKKMVHTIEDYTMLVFIMSYFVMLIACIYLFVVMRGVTTNAVVSGLVGGAVITIILGILIYNIL